jgi:hypothetical protein
VRDAIFVEEAEASAQLLKDVKNESFRNFAVHLLELRFKIFEVAAREIGKDDSASRALTRSSRGIPDLKILEDVRVRTKFLNTIEHDQFRNGSQISIRRQFQTLDDNYLTSSSDGSKCYITLPT